MADMNEVLSTVTKAVNKAYQEGKADRNKEILEKMDEGVCEYCDKYGSCKASNCGSEEYEAFKKWIKEP